MSVFAIGLGTRLYRDLTMSPCAVSLVFSFP